MEKPPLHLVISYVPLLTGEAGSHVEADSDQMSDLFKKIDSLPSGFADAILWSQSSEGDPWPIFVMEDANRILDHLVDWSEGSPTSWFDFRLHSRGSDYAMALMPKVEKSIDRYKLAIGMQTGITPPKDGNYKVLFKSIHFSSTPGETSTFSIVKPMMKSSVKIGFLEKSELGANGEIPGDFDPKKIYWIGPFDVQPDYQNFLANMLPKKSKNRQKFERRARRG